MDALYMDGMYEIQMTTQNEGQRNTYLNLGPEVFPNTPQVTNFPAAQTINATTYTKTTELTMTAPGTKPILSITTGTPAGSVLLSWNADIGRTYDLRSSSDLVTWNSVSLLTAATTSLQYTHTPSGTQVFYRLQAPP